jgi:serine/threonine protein phosphatase PrpC
VKVSACGRTDVGRRRTNNEDGFVIRDLAREATLEPACVEEELVGDRGLLLAVCDGMGGPNAGEVASSLALEGLEEEMQRLSDACPRPELFEKAVAVVNRRVWAEASLHPDLSGMGTTLTAALICQSRALIAHVGDSRAYFARKRPGRADHEGPVDRRAARRLRDADGGAGTGVPVPPRPAPGRRPEGDGGDRPRRGRPRPGDTLLLCSDGLSGKVGIADLAAHLAGDDLPAIADALVALANERGGEDNITVVLARIS